MVGMHAPLGLRLQDIIVCLDALYIAVHIQRSARIGHIDTLRTVTLHQLCLLRQCRGFSHVRHHQKSGRIHAKLTRHFDVLLRYVGLCAVRSDADGSYTHVIGAC